MDGVPDRKIQEPESVSIVLTGFMGSGKTTVGRLLARRLRRRFVDMDEEIEVREGRVISEIFATDGEVFFRAIERRLVRELSACKGLIIATGGGVVLDSENVSDFEKSGLLVCLDAAPERILERVSHETHRPLLAAPDKQKRIRELLDARRAAYAVIGVHIDTDELAPAEVAEKILELYSERISDS